MTFQTETVLSCSVPPSSRGFERLNTEKPTTSAILAVSIAAHALGTIVFLHPTTPAPRNRP
jgi:hypothetical protein